MRVADVLRCVLATQGKPRLWLVTQSAQAVAPNEIVDAVQAAIWGIARIVSVEHPDVWGGVIDGPREWDERNAAAATIVMTSGQAEDQVAIRDGFHYVPRIQCVHERAALMASLSARSSYVVTGGLGYLGLQVARLLVERGARRLILISRRAHERAALHRQAVDQLRSTGASVGIVEMDICDGAALAQFLTQPDFDLGGIFHAAGIRRAVPLLAADRDYLREVMAAKVMESGICTA